MVLIIQLITIDLIGAPAAYRRVYRQGRLRAMKQLGTLWHRKYRPRHFRKDADTIYQEYQPRKRSYEKRKAREKPQAGKLVFTGVTRALSKRKTITATHKSVTISMNIRGLNRRARGSRINMRAEFLAISPDEEKEMNALHEQVVDKWVTNAPNRRRVKV